MRPPTTASPDKGLWTIKQTADFLQIGERSARRHVKEGRLRAVKFGRSIRFRPADVHDFGRPQ
jgi:excisionase family DNA binding protein